MGADDWSSGERLAEAMRTLQGLLLAGEARQRDAYRQRYVVDGSGGDGDVERARQLLGWLLDSLTVSDKPERWRQLSAMVDVARLEQPPRSVGLDSTAPLLTAIDVTLPAATELKPHFAGPATESMDESVAAVGDALESAGFDDDPTKSDRRAPGGTLRTGKSPQEVLDIEKYAVLCAWSEVHPGRRDALHAQYGLASEQARAALDEEFEARFRADPRVRAAFAQRLRLHLGWLRRG